MAMEGESVIPSISKELAAREAMGTTGMEPNANLPFLITDENVENAAKAYFPELLPLLSKLIGISIIPKHRLRYYHALVDVSFDLMEASKPEDYLNVSMTAMIETFKIWAHLKIDNACEGALLDKVTRTTRALEYTETGSKTNRGFFGIFRR